MVPLRYLLTSPIGLTAFLLISGLAASARESDTGESLIARAREGWRKYQDEISKLPIEVLVRYKSTIDGKLETDRNILVARDAGRQRFESQLQIDEAGGRRKAGRTTTFITNPKYTSELQRDDASAPWKLIGTEIVRNDADTSKGLRQRAEMSLTQLQWPLHFDGGISLLRLCERPGFKVTGFIRSHRDGCELVAIHFVNPNDVTNQQEPDFFPIAEGEITLLPNHRWCLDSYRVIYRSSLREMSMTAKLEYEDTSQRILLPRKCVGRNTITRATDTTVKTVASEREFKFSPREKKLDPSQFYLTGYGLPEISNAYESDLVTRLGWLPYLLGAVLVIGIVLVFCRHQRSQRLFSREA